MYGRGKWPPSIVSKNTLPRKLYSVFVVVLATPRLFPSSSATQQPRVDS
ncbi:hypothetical protein DsansV1_C25g0185571 [Dioscorea sansibarensis]